jgi:hypothetical protein
MNAPQHDAKDQGPQETAAPSAPAAPKKPVIVRMDKSRDYANVHGDRPAGDPDIDLHYTQDSLPFDAHGRLLLNHHSIESDPKKQKKVEVLLLKAMKRQEANPGDRDPEDDDEIEENLDDTFADPKEEDDDGEGPINLSDWAAGTAQYPWQDISNALASRYATRVMNKKQALELLIRERVTTPGQLSKSNRRTLEQD